MATDALAALDIWGCSVDVGPITVVVPALPARQWMLAILGTDTAGPILPGMLGPADESAVMGLLVDGVIDFEEDLVRLQREVLEEISGMRWWEADRLIRSAAGAWQVIGGELTRLSVDLDAISLAALLNTIYVICTRGLDAEKKGSFDFELSRPPAGVPAAVLYDQQAAESAFLALMAQATPPGQ